ncbi:MAG TPA: hypothetical protein VMZ92_10430, partial [Planctomycetota bacterium]|nr:hypothetical protein [Planctomycetota bacterium]
MSGRRTVLIIIASVCSIVAAGPACAEETQDSPLYAYTLQNTLKRLEGQTTVVTQDENPLSGVMPPEGEFLQAATSQPVGPTVCNPRKTLCPVRTTACPSPVATACPQRTTRCPTILTQCPDAATTCPERHTRCPGGATNCPIQRTQCPARDTACPPAVATVCPAQRTQCPVRDTACPATVATQCPQHTTECPAQATHCPLNATTCPPRHTRCPAQATFCPLDETVCPAQVTKCPADLPTACPQRTTRCPVRQTVCPGGVTNCPVANTACPVIGTMCPAAACVPGGPIVTFMEPGTTTIEFSYDRSNPGVLVVYCQLTLNAVAAAIPGVEDMIRVVIQPIGLIPGGSLLEWWAPNPVPPGGVSLSPWVGSALGQPANTHPLMGKARLNTNPASPAFGTYEVSAVFTGLPDRNDFFGAKTVYAQIVEAGIVVATTPQPIEVFYDRIGRTWYIPNPFTFPLDPNLPVYNNPGTGTSYGPNWYYYWKNPVCPIRTGPTPCACVIKGGFHDWQYYHEYTYGFYVPGEDHVNVGAAAEWVNSGHEWFANKYSGAVMCVSGTGIGPHCCGEVVA